MDLILLWIVVGLAYLVLFVMEGLVVGKLFQPAVIFVAYVTVLTPPWPLVGALVVVSAVGATFGQWVLYRAFTPERAVPGGDRWPFALLSRLPRMIRRWLGQRWVAFVERQFDRFGGVAICCCTALPAIRTVVPIVAGVGAYPDRRYVAVAGVGNLLYMLLLVAAAYGVLGISRLFIGI